MTLYPFDQATHLNPDWLRNNFGLALRLQMLNTIRQAMDRSITMSAGQQDVFADAYIDADGRMNSVVAAGTGAIFDTNKYKYEPTPFILIEASALTISDFAINNCSATLVSTGKWLIKCSTGTSEVKRAQIMKTLFYGSNGTDPRISLVTGITALKTNISRDVGCRAYKLFGQTSCGQSSTGTSQYKFDGVFQNTTDNHVSSWSYVSRYSNAATSSGGSVAAWYIPTSTQRTSVVAGPTSGTLTIDELGADTTADEVDNPADCTLNSYTNDTYTGVYYTMTALVVILTKGEITLTVTESATGSATKTGNQTDFMATIPEFTALDDAYNLAGVIEHTIPAGKFPANVSSAMASCMITPEWETGADIKFKLTNATEDTGWLDMGNSPTLQTFTAFTSEPTKFIVKLVPKSVSPSAGYPAIYGSAVYADVRGD